MDGWRRQRRFDYDPKVSRTRSQSRKPPQGGNWKPTVPSWEKEFCKQVGSVSWQKLLESKKYIHLYENVMKWNDSAGEEAFHNAKSRFWAKINGLPCDISLPGPDIYLDKIDWNSEVDPELLRDLEDPDSVVPDRVETDEKVVTLSKHLLSNEPFYCTGWGDAEDDPKKVPNFSDNKENPWEDRGTRVEGGAREHGWGDECCDSWNDNKNNGAAAKRGESEDFCKNSWEKSWAENEGSEVVVEGRHRHHWNDSWDQRENSKDDSGVLNNSSDWNNVKKGDATRYMSRYKTSRFQKNDHYTTGESRKKGRNRVNYFY